ncbi:hypothetical protein CTAYLR_002755 [Chrysophaeum taylorii]|uniref:Eukaryotic translation initiation factor 3 subunit A n=1 Tax=Chrysophaeum taylorii TaxID=2483200 RepID=A0AAD7UCZ0_9STRA|nr:hypothetical protein CTAYLR_002755 [Chrysophaeum taylorii]
MANQYFHKPENALKRANELANIGNKKAALQVLHDVLTAKKSRTWQKVFEQIMIKYIDICVELQMHRHAKDGLHQYRNISQQQAPNSLEIVIKYLVESAEAKANAAAAKPSSATMVADLENEQTPESIMMSTVTEENDSERNDREILVPWLKFLWETYRSVLDILKTNSKLERVYHETSVKAFEFCRRFERRTELRRLCDTLRQHLSNLQRAAAQPAQQSNRFRGWEGWTQEGVEMHLTTRFAQLEVASKLELWTEGFRTVEDIYAVMKISKKPPKARLMAKYYERLTRIFWVSGNYLFHAYTWWRHYRLARESEKRPATPEERTHRACSAVLAALSIPDVAASQSQKGAVTEWGGSGVVLSAAEDDVDAEKNARMATLLGFATRPTRAALLAEVVDENKILAECPEHVRALYQALERTFAPLELAGMVTPLLRTLEEKTPRLAMYSAPLARLAATRVVRQLADVYSCVDLDWFHEKIGELGLSRDDVETLVVGAATFSGDQQRPGAAFPGGGVLARLDYRNKCLRFVDDEASAPTSASLAETPPAPNTLAGVVAAKMRDGILPPSAAAHLAAATRVGGSPVARALEELHAQLEATRDVLDKNGLLRSTEETRQDVIERAAERETLFAAVRRSVDAEHERCVTRKAVIERRKEEQERLQQEKLKAEAEQKHRLEEERKKDEEKRLKREAMERDAERMDKMKKEMALQEATEKLKMLGKDVAEGDLTDMAETERQELIERTREEAAKQRLAEEQRLAEQAKRLDYVTRALRLEELPVLEALYTKLCDDDRKAHEDEYEKSLERHKAEHAANLAEKRRLERAQPHCPAFERAVVDARRAAHEKRVAERRAAREAERRKRKIARARRRYDENIEEMERLRQEDEEVAAAAAADARRAEEARLERERREEERRLAADRDAAKEACRAAMHAEALARRAEEEAKRKAEREAQLEREEAEKAARDPTNSNWRRRLPNDIPPAEDDAVPRRGAGSYRPRLEDDGAPMRRGFGDGSRRGGFDDGPRRGGFDDGPRRGGFDDGPRRGGGFDDGPRRGGGFDDGPRRGGGFDDGPRRGGGFDDGPRRGGGFDDRRGGGFDDRRGGGFDDRRGGGYDDGPRRGGLGGRYESRVRDGYGGSDARDDGGSLWRRGVGRRADDQPRKGGGDEGVSWRRAQSDDKDAK